MDNLYHLSNLAILICICFYINLDGVSAGDSCAYVRKGTTRYVYCDYGCCGSETDRSCCSYEVSTSVLIVAYVVGGIVVVALLAAVIVCCYKNFKDKQASRVRNIRQQERNNVPRQPAQPPKPPQYVDAPPVYSENMPDSHFRPQTVTGRHTPSNQRFVSVYNHSGQPVTRSQASRIRNSTQSTENQNTNPPSAVASGVYVTNSSGMQPTPQNRQSNSTEQLNAQLPGSISEAPPPYSEFIRGQTPANRRRRLIQTPVNEESNEIETETSTPVSRVTSSQGSRNPARVQPAPPYTETSEQSQGTRTRMNLRSTAASNTNRRITDDNEVLEDL